mgnify:FL=1
MNVILIDQRSIGATIKSLRLKNHLTQEELAAMTFYSIRTIRRVERDGTDSIEVINTFAEALKVSAIDIIR